MAQIKRPDGQLQVLGETTTFGRDAACAVRIDGGRASRLHACVAWSRGRWVVRDLGSRNGTWVDGERLVEQVPRELHPGARLAFADPALTWVFEDDGPPVPLATRLRDGVQQVGFEDLLCLDDDGASASVWRGPGGWCCELDGVVQPVADGAQITVRDAWRLSLPGSAATTMGFSLKPALDQVRMVLWGSRDLEHVRLTLRAVDGDIELEDRQHWFILWILAHARTEDASAPGHDQGWVDVDDLAKETGIERQHLDSYISRARKDIAAAGVQDAARVVEARKGQRRIGLPVERLELRR